MGGRTIAKREVSGSDCVGRASCALEGDGVVVLSVCGAESGVSIGGCEGEDGKEEERGKKGVSHFKYKFKLYFEMGIVRVV